MSFEVYEESIESGQPIELLELRMDSDAFFYTNNQIAVTIDAREYLPLSFKRNRIQLSVEGQKTERLDVSIPGDNEFVLRFVNMAPGSRPTLFLKRYHRQDVDAAVIVEYRGVIQTVNFSENGDIATLQVAALTSAKSRNMPRLTYQGLCGLMLYDEFCQISETDPRFEKFLSCTAVSGQNVTMTGASAFGSDFFVSGFIQFGTDYRMITEQSGDVLRLLLPFGLNPAGEILRCLAGCKHRFQADCDNKFDNIVNYGGFPFVPSKNPFATGLD